MAFGNTDLMAEIRGFLGFPADQSMVSLILRTIFVYGLFTSLFRYVFPKKAKPCFDSKPSEKALTMADNSAERVSDNADGREELRRVFSTFDKNGDGLISQQELKESFERLRLCIGEEELLYTIRTVDVNGDGYVDFDEFVTLYESMRGKGAEEEEAKADHMDEDADLAEAFGVFDENGDGLITVEELQSVLKSLDLKEGRTIGDCKKMIQKVDKDGDGMVSYMEFKEMMSAGFGKI
jgi:calcium-binding protein CML